MSLMQRGCKAYEGITGVFFNYRGEDRGENRGDVVERKLTLQEGVRA
jgi:hypothetical protein